MERGMTFMELLVALLIISIVLWPVVFFVKNSGVHLELMIEHEKRLQKRD